MHAQLHPLLLLAGSPCAQHAVLFIAPQAWTPPALAGSASPAALACCEPAYTAHAPTHPPLAGMDATGDAAVSGPASTAGDDDEPLSGGAVEQQV